MKTYSVSIPIAGSITVSVQADNREAAIEAAWKAYDKAGEDGEFDLKGETCDVDWVALSKMTSGNVTYFELNEVEVYEERE